MQACIIACGRGTRLDPFTRDRPKALIPLGEQTVLAHQLHVLHQWGIDDVTIVHRNDHDPTLAAHAVSHLSEHHRIRIATAPPHWPGVYEWLCKRFTTARTPVVTLNCDLVLDPSWGDILDEHTHSGAAMTLAAAPHPGPEEGQYGRPRLLTLTADRSITATRPPPSTGLSTGIGETIAHQIGVSVVSPSAWPHLVGLAHHTQDPWADEFVPALIRAGRHVRIAVRTAPWRDVGTWYRLWLAHRDLAHTAPDKQHVHPTAQISATARITGWVYLGPDTRVGEHALIQDSAVLTGAEVAEDASLIDGLALPGAHLDNRTPHHANAHLPGAAVQPMPQAPHT